MLQYEEKDKAHESIFRGWNSMRALTVTKQRAFNTVLAEVDKARITSVRDFCFPSADHLAAQWSVFLALTPVGLSSPFI